MACTRLRWIAGGKLENSIWLPNVLNNLGVLQHLTGDYKAAISSYEKALQYAHRSGYARIEAFILTGIGDIYIELNAIDEALDALPAGNAIAQRQHPNLAGLPEHPTSRDSLWKGEFSPTVIV